MISNMISGMEFCERDSRFGTVIAQCRKVSDLVFLVSHSLPHLLHHPCILFRSPIRPTLAKYNESATILPKIA